MTRPIAFDVTHLASRLPVSHPTGIDKVDLAYAERFGAQGCEVAVHYGLARPRFHEGALIAPLVAIARSGRWLSQPADADRVLASIARRLGVDGQAGGSPAERAPAGHDGSGWKRRVEQVKWRVSRGTRGLPEGSIYLNVAQHVFEAHRFFAWLKERPDVKSVFLVHDLLPLDYPEYFKAGYKERFRKRADTIVNHARAIITTTQTVKCRLIQEFESRGMQPVPIHVANLPSPLSDHIGGGAGGALATGLAREPYFVALGTIEPRKNHLLLLNVWRRLAQQQESPPKLVIVGARGWENEQVLDVLDRSALVRPHVIECSGLGDHGLAVLLQSARGLLMPSFAEGYGLPVVEALSVGTPVVASDLPVFRETGQGRAIYRHPLDGLGWMETILALADRESEVARRAREDASGFVVPTWERYFGEVEGFVHSL